MTKDEKNTLVVCIDRDDDLGEKTDMEGPVIGREELLEAANSLALADPEDSDSNTVFETVRTYDELLDDGESVEAVLLTGHVDVGVKSDKSVTAQLDEVLEETGASEIVLVTDGTQDERITPLIQQRADIVATKRVVMKQSERLEGIYHMVHDFVDNPEMAKIVLGVPALALLLVAFFGPAGWRIIMGVIGLYLFVKGFRMESRVNQISSEIFSSLKQRRVEAFFYVASGFIALVGVKGGMDFIREVGPVNTLETVAAFIQGSTFLLFIGFSVALVGRLLTVLDKKKEIAKYITYGSLGLGMALVGFEASNLILTPETGFTRLFSVIVFGLFILVAARGIERIV